MEASGRMKGTLPLIFRKSNFYNGTTKYHLFGINTGFSA
jgi:hypothetical protein